MLVIATFQTKSGSKSYVLNVTFDLKVRNPIIDDNYDNPIPNDVTCPMINPGPASGLTTTPIIGEVINQVWFMHIPALLNLSNWYLGEFSYCQHIPFSQYNLWIGLQPISKKCEILFCCGCINHIPLGKSLA